MEDTLAGRCVAGVGGQGRDDTVVGGRVWGRRNRVMMGGVDGGQAVKRSQQEIQLINVL
jgi:hypothetical protein